MHSAPLTVTLVLGACPPERRTVARRIANDLAALVTIERPIGVGSIATLIDEAVDALLAHPVPPRRLVIDCGATVQPVDAVSAVITRAPDVLLDAVVTVVDAAHILLDLEDDRYIGHPSADVVAYTSRAMITMEQLEYADTIAVAGRHGVSHERLAVLLALLSNLNPTALVRLADASRTARYTDSPFDLDRFTGSPGWVSKINGEHTPWVEHPRVTTTLFESARPMHPGRLFDLFDGPIEAGRFGRIVRTAGFCQLASRGSAIGMLQQVGTMLELDPTPFDASHPETAIGQELVFTGIDVDTAALLAALHDCALTDAELLADPVTWAGFPDAFTVWLEPHPTDRD
ncbi:GTP-binding protein [Plantibacter sp. YIM 135249]|uniref:GTP-binding protein n=1 Tax=Plantibacter sp. YIM 135249 TaxID=3423918 RepID=UPI003D34D3D5